MKIINVFFSVLFFVFLSSCDDWKVEKEPVDISNKLVIYSTICPEDDSIKVYISAVKEIGTYKLTGLNSEILDANVVLKSGSEEITIPYSKQSKNYKISKSAFPLKYNTKYTLVVNRNNVTSTSVCTIPSNVVIPSVFLTFQKDTVSGKVEWQKNNNLVEEYYLQHSLVYDKNKFGMFNWEDGIFANRSNTLILNKASQVTLLANQYIGDPRNNNKNFKSIKFTSTLFLIDENMSKYVKSTINVGDTPNNNPEFIEKFVNPTSRYGNITNAVGVFMAYSKKTAIIYYERP